MYFFAFSFDDTARTVKKKSHVYITNYCMRKKAVSTMCLHLNAIEKYQQ